jgi:hypothetical protein
MSENTENEHEDAPILWTISPEIKAEIAAKKLVEARLEEKYSDRGLKFTRGFSGSAPVQAWGIIDGYRFYFRYRSDVASIRIGFIADDRLQREHDRDMHFRKERFKRFGGGDASLRELMLGGAHGPYELDGITDYPSSIRKEAYISGVLDDPYNGFLTPEQTEETFVKLIEGLKDVSYEDPVTIEL